MNRSLVCVNASTWRMNTFLMWGRRLFSVWLGPLSMWMGLLCVWLGLLCLWIGLFCVWIGPLRVWLGLFRAWMGLFCVWIGLCGMWIGLFCVWIGLFGVWIGHFCLANLPLFVWIRHIAQKRDSSRTFQNMSLLCVDRSLLCVNGFHMCVNKRRSDPDSKHKTETEHTFWCILPYLAHSEPFNSNRNRNRFVPVPFGFVTICDICDQNVTKSKKLKKIRECDRGHTFKIVTFFDCH